MVFRNIKKEKELFERELEQWKNEKRFEAKEVVRKFKEDSDAEIVKLAKMCADDTKNYEHDFHSQREKLGISIAKLEAKKEALKEIVENDKACFEKIIESKDAEIERLNAILTTMADKEPQSVVIHTK